METMRKYKVNDNKKFFNDYKKMLSWVMRNPDKPFPIDKWRSSSVGLQNMYVLCKDYAKLLENRDKLMEFYQAQYPDVVNDVVDE